MLNFNIDKNQVTNAQAFVDETNTLHVYVSKDEREVNGASFYEANHDYHYEFDCDGYDVNIVNDKNTLSVNLIKREGLEYAESDGTEIEE